MTTAPTSPKHGQKWNDLERHPHVRLRRYDGEVGEWVSAEEFAYREKKRKEKK